MTTAMKMLLIVFIVSLVFVAVNLYTNISVTKITTPSKYQSYTYSVVAVMIVDSKNSSAIGTAIYCETQDCWEKGYALATDKDLAVIFDFNNLDYTAKCFYNPFNYTIYLYKYKFPFLTTSGYLNPGEKACIIVEPSTLVIETRQKIKEFYIR